MAVVRTYVFFILAFLVSIMGLWFTFWFNAGSKDDFWRFVLALYIYPTCQIVSIFWAGYHWVKESRLALPGLVVMATTCLWSQLIIALVAVFWV